MKILFTISTNSQGYIESVECVADSDNTSEISITKHVFPYYTYVDKFKNVSHHEDDNYYYLYDPETQTVIDEIARSPYQKFWRDDGTYWEENHREKVEYFARQWDLCSLINKVKPYGFLDVFKDVEHPNQKDKNLLSQWTEGGMYNKLWDEFSENVFGDYATNEVEEMFVFSILESIDQKFVDFGLRYVKRPTLNDNSTNRIRCPRE